jgi:hypothetical protein
VVSRKRQPACLIGVGGGTASTLAAENRLRTDNDRQNSEQKSSDPRTTTVHPDVLNSYSLKSDPVTG